MNKGIRAGEMDRRIRLDYQVITTNAYQEQIVDWTEWTTTNATFQPRQTQQKEGFAQDQLLSEKMATWCIRYITAVTAPTIPDTKMRLVDEYGQVYDIEQVNVIPRRRGWELRTKAKE